MENQIIFTRNHKNSSFYIVLAIGAFLVALIQILGGIWIYIDHGSLFHQSFLAPVWIVIGLSWLYRRNWNKKTPYVKINNKEMTVFQDFLRTPVFFELHQISSFKRKNKRAFILTLNDGRRIKIFPQNLEEKDFEKLQSIIICR